MNLVRVLAVSKLLVLCSCVHVAPPFTMVENDGVFPALTDPAAIAYGRRFSELSKIVDADPEGYFRAGAAIPCEVPEEIKERLLLDMTRAELERIWKIPLGIEIASFTLLSGSCEGGTLSGPVTYVGSMKTNGAERVVFQTKKRRAQGTVVDGALSGKSETVDLETRADVMTGGPETWLRYGFADVSGKRVTGLNAYFGYRTTGSPFTSSSIIEPLASGRIKKVTTYYGSELSMSAHYLNDGSLTLQGPVINRSHLRGAGIPEESRSCYQNGEVVESTTCPLEPGPGEVFSPAPGVGGIKRAPAPVGPTPRPAEAK